jgi:hypothetical protein
MVYSSHLFIPFALNLWPTLAMRLPMMLPCHGLVRSLSANKSPFVQISQLAISCWALLYVWLFIWEKSRAFRNDMGVQLSARSALSTTRVRRTDTKMNRQRFYCRWLRNISLCFEFSLSHLHLCADCVDMWQPRRLTNLWASAACYNDRWLWIRQQILRAVSF